MAYKIIDTGTGRKHGLASLAVQNNRLILVFPRKCFDGKQKTMSLGLIDNPSNRNIAMNKLNAVQNDINFDQFDETLERYKPQTAKAEYKGKVAQLENTINLLKLWNLYIEYKKPTIKETTLDYLENTIKPHLVKSGITSPYKALELRDYLLSHTTQSMAKRVLTHAKSAFDWGSKYKLVKGNNPYQGMAREFKHRYEIESKPNAFSPDEKDKIIKDFEENKYYSHYTNFVKFLFLTGCRPSEAIGLRWNDVIENFEKIRFTGGLVQLSTGALIRTEGSKNNRRREFPCNSDLKHLLNSLSFVRITDLVFPSPKGKAINYENFSQRAWARIVDPIKPNTTPYSCRDTFITEQIRKGVSSSIIAKWVDNSTSTIDRYYLDPFQLDKIFPQ
jgi:integrase